MGKSIALKFVAILLAVVSLVGMAFSVLGIVLLAEKDLYKSTPADYLDSCLEIRADTYAGYVVYNYTMSNLSQFPQESNKESWLEWFGAQDSTDTEGSYFYTILDSDGNTLESNYDQLSSYGYAITDMNEYTFSRSAEYVVVEQVQYGVDYYESFTEYVETDGALYSVEYCTGPTYTVWILLSDSALIDSYGFDWQLTLQLYAIRYQLMAYVAVALVLLLSALVYLGWAAGRKPGSNEIAPGGLNRLPLDLYLGICGVAVVVLIALAFEALDVGLNGSSVLEIPMLAVSAVLCCASGAICVAFYCALAAQVKVKGGYWWRHCVLTWILGKIWKGIRWMLRGIRKLLSLMPLTWRFLLAGFLLWLLLTIAAVSRNGIGLVLSSLLFAAAVIYSGYAFGVIYSGIRRMRKGCLSAKVSTRYLFGSYRDIADGLNALADVAVVAAREQTKSERMKTELIANVSHDIKTPLTSIINYVDLLGKPHTQEEGQQYLDVLARQSQRMKKLLEDLMEMSKASTGNLHVQINTVDAVEAINQALGEFSDKMAAVQLSPVFTQPRNSVYILADGSLVWRVLSNLLGNVVKYALPGTRLYLDLAEVGENVVISLKNVSREQLNISADELMERFVRGDAARNTEGSGLGLNIARSLMELQHGSLDLTVDGDLFKVTLTFPAFRG